MNASILSRFHSENCSESSFGYLEKHLQIELYLNLEENSLYLHLFFEFKRVELISQIHVFSTKPHACGSCKDQRSITLFPLEYQSTFL
jgi:hypothetical protein